LGDVSGAVTELIVKLHVLTIDGAEPAKVKNLFELIDVNGVQDSRQVSLIII
jgi:hypothetical protein